MRPGPRTSDLGPIALALILLTTSGCRDTFYPLKNRITPGLDAFVVFAADGQAGAGELWAGQAGGGNVFQLTYTLSDEDLPALSPSGDVLAFVRSPTRADTASRRIWFMNLTTGNERDLPLLPDSTIPLRLAFSTDGARLFARTRSGLWTMDAPPAPSIARRATGPDSITADSALTVFVGEPAFARIDPCLERSGWICAFPPGQKEAPLQEGGIEPVHWGADSIGYFVGDRLVVRSGAGGRSREVMWVRLPAHPHAPTYAPKADSSGR